MPASFHRTLQNSYYDTPDYAHRVNELAAKLDKIEGIPDEARAILVELFEAIGRAERARK